jgi:F-type H+-transporting ATPase subunit gamma
MSETVQALRRKISSAEQLGSVVRTMKGLAAASILQYEAALRSVTRYYRTVELGLAACLREWRLPDSEPPTTQSPVAHLTGAIVIGSDQGLVGLFNDRLARFVIDELAGRPGEKTLWVVGEQVHTRLQHLGLALSEPYSVPNSVTAIAPLVGQILIDGEPFFEQGEILVLYNRPSSRTNYRPVVSRLLPLDEQWQRELQQLAWPTKLPPEVIGEKQTTILGLVREYLFVSLFRACAESLASENASRLIAMQRAQRNIDELLNVLRVAFYQERQAEIDQELFEVVSGFEVLAEAKPKRGR